jgi:hypothetical protein
MARLHVQQTQQQQKLARMLAKQAQEALKKEINGQLMVQLQAQRRATADAIPRHLLSRASCPAREYAA